MVKVDPAMDAVVALGVEGGFGLHFSGFGVHLRSLLNADLRRAEEFCSGLRPSTFGRL